MPSFYAGFALALSLIVIIGAQNAFVLRHALTRQHIFIVCLICAFADTLLITAGVFGFDHAITQYPWLAPTARYAGAAFLIAYAAHSFYLAYHNTNTLTPTNTNTASLTKTITTCLAITFLNPHVYLDTVVLLGSVSTQYPNQHLFAAGGATASFTFFFTLGYAATLLNPLFANPTAWRILDAIIGTLMLTIAATLLLN